VVVASSRLEAALERVANQLRDPAGYAFKTDLDRGAESRFEVAGELKAEASS
jgi:hypothetical protein